MGSTSIARQVRRIVDATSNDFVVLRELAAELGHQRAVERALIEDVRWGILLRVGSGLYWKGSRIPILRAALKVAELAGHPTGVGPTGQSAAWSLHLSMEPPETWHVVVPGRPPAAPIGVVFHARAARGRIGLDPVQIAWLELIRDPGELDWRIVTDALVTEQQRQPDRAAGVLKAAAREWERTTRARGRELAERISASQPPGAWGPQPPGALN